MPSIFNWLKIGNFFISKNCNLINWACEIIEIWIFPIFGNGCKLGFVFALFNYNGIFAYQIRIEF